jgi:hypothetical protein
MLGFFDHLDENSMPVVINHLGGRRFACDLPVGLLVGFLLLTN